MQIIVNNLNTNLYQYTQYFLFTNIVRNCSTGYTHVQASQNNVIDVL